ncbi:Myb/SANT-like DNA-binding domain-containing protein [Carex littledalei]|uniref:Myb/SANT-like DNA-binding domain-containing protein n=1 Tax=Carex littledalei TaxID=544730 RepID=A0A833RR78_9POAL|nr:Myb/SANT-like DNA-binding domain-containing protein [Carex littledalei]
MTGEGNRNESLNRAAWNDLQKAFLVELLVEFNRPGARLQNAWSSVAWNEMTRRFKAKFVDSNFSLKQLKEQERTLKKAYKTINRLRDLSGFGWDPTRKMVDAPEEVWAPILQTDKEAKRWYNKPFPHYDDLHSLYSGCIANGSRRRGSNYFANPENQVEMNSPSPTIPAPGGLNDFGFDDDFLGTQTFDHISTQSQAPPNVHTPHSVGVSSVRKTIQKKKRKAMSTFHENYLEYKREELTKYCAVMEKNANKSVERADKYSVAAAMEAFEQLSDFDMLNFVNASDMFIKKAETREAFLTVSEEHRSEWIKRMIELWKSN